MKPLENSELSHLKILLIEDNPGDVKLVQIALSQNASSLSFGLKVAGSLAEGLARIEEGGVDIVLLDLNLPDSFGFETFLNLHAKQPEVPTIVLSSSGNEEMAVRTVKEGAQDYLFKDDLDNYSLVVRIIRYAYERYQIRNQLLSIEGRLRTVIESTTDGIIVVDSQGRVQFANPAAEAVLAGGDSLVGREFPFPIRVGEELEVSAPMPENGGSRTLSLKTAQTTWDGKPAYCASVREITERKQMELALERERQRLSQVLSEAPIAIAMFDRDMHYVTHSRKWLTDYDLSGLRIVGRSHYEVLPGMAEKWKPLCERAWQGEGFSVLEDTFTDAKGKPVHLRWALHPLKDHRQQVNALILVTDRIDELVAARQSAERAARMKTEFLANMSHEIRTPMNGVIGMTSLLLETELNQEQREYVETIRNSGEVLLTVLNDILDLSKIEAGKIDLELNDFSLRQALEETVELFSEQARQKMLNLTAIASPLPAHLRGDPWRLRQILANLLSNALKFTERGEVCLRARQVRDEGERVLVRFEVSDTGIGIGPEGIRRLFQPFSQTDSSMTRKFGGTGLGLAISKKLSELMGGEIGVESQPGVGSRFWFTALLEKPADAESLVPAHRLEDRRALVVGRDAIFAQRVSEMLGLVGMQTEACATLASSLTTLRASADRFDAVLVDADALGPADTAVLVEQARAMGVPPAALIGISAQTSNSDWESAHLGSVLKRPLRQSELYSTLQELCLPAGATKAPAAASERTSPTNKEPHVHGLVLVAEDNSVNQKIILRMLQKLGYRADFVANGAEAVAAAARVPYSAILMDCQMPEMDGFEATQKIREQSKARVPIIAMTAHALKGDKERCFAAGMDDYVSKPVKLETIKEILERWMPVAEAGEEASEQAAVEARLDTELLSSWRALTDEGEDDFLTEVIDIFLRDTPGLLNEVRQGIQRADHRSLQRFAHKLKGSSANLGAQGMASLCGELEAIGASTTEGFERAPALFEDLEREFQRVQETLVRDWRLPPAPPKPGASTGALH